MRHQSTAHGIRVDARGRSTTDWLEVAAECAPVGFDDERDGLCIHRSGTVLYVGPSVPRLLGLEGRDSAIGGQLLELFGTADRVLLESALDEAARDTEGVARPIWATVSRCGAPPCRVELTARRARDATPPVDFLYVRSASALDAGEDERLMTTLEQKRRHGPADRATVLICDDESRLGVLTAGLLTEYGFLPVTVGTGDEALAAIDAGNPAVDVLLLDVNLTQGSSARQVLQKLGELLRPPCVVLTSGLAEEDVDPDLMSHPIVAGYVAKPYAVEQLVQSIGRALGRVDRVDSRVDRADRTDRKPD